MITAHLTNTDIFCLLLLFSLTPLVIVIGIIATADHRPSWRAIFRFLRRSAIGYRLSAIFTPVWDVLCCVGYVAIAWLRSRSSWSRSSGPSPTNNYSRSGDAHFPPGTVRGMPTFTINS